MLGEAKNRCFLETFLGDKLEAIALDSGIDTMAAQEHESIFPVDNSVTGEDS